MKRSSANPSIKVICLITTCLIDLRPMSRDRPHLSPVLLLSFQRLQGSLSGTLSQTEPQFVLSRVLPGSQMNHPQAVLPSGQRHQDHTGFEDRATGPMYRCVSLQYNSPRKSVLPSGSLPWKNAVKIEDYCPAAARQSSFMAAQTS
jgi:hypothetical protein